MKSNYLLTLASLLLCSCIILQSCVKDTCQRNQRYNYYVPVYKTKAAVKAGVKSSAPQQILKPGKIFTIGNYIFVNEIDKGIHIIDNTNPASPQNISFIDIPGNEDLAVTGNILYADMFTDLVTLDISDPLNVRVTKFMDGVFPFRYWSGGFSQDTNMVVVDFIKRDTIVVENCTDNNPGIFYDVMPSASSSGTTAASSAPGTAGSMARFALVNKRLYTVSNEDLNIFSIEAPQNPAYTKKVNVSSSQVETIFPFKNKLFIGSSNGMFIYSIDNADDPAMEGQFAHVRTCDPVIADDNFAYVTLHSGTGCGGYSNQMDVLDISNLNNPVLIKSYPFTSPHGLSKDKNLLFICDGTDGLRILDATHAGNMIALKRITGIETYDVIAANNKAIVVAADGLYQYSYADVNNIHLLSKITIEK